MPGHPFPPTRAEARRRLAGFVPRAGRDYAALRNHDLPGHPHVSGLSPYVRHRLITEEEVLRAVLGRHSPAAAGKFVQEVFWRTYWKGWLELRPSVWTGYRTGLTAALNRVQTESGLRAEWEAACNGDTGIACFDHWARELAETGYLHNHARMWFASIWCFTLRLPWQLGADFFLRHLLDGDPASNTLGWRWVAGLQTPGKTYTATAANIAKYTGGRFDPGDRLATDTAPLDGPPNPPPDAPPASGSWDRHARIGLLLTEDDLSPGFLFDQGLAPETTAVLIGADRRSPLRIAAQVGDFTRAAAQDCLTRHGDRMGRAAGVFTTAEEVAGWARASGLSQIVMAHAPCGPAADILADLPAICDIPLVRVLRPYDARAWPHATRGFFAFRDRIPSLLAALAPRPA